MKCLQACQVKKEYRQTLESSERIQSSRSPLNHSPLQPSTEKTGRVLNRSGLRNKARGAKTTCSSARGAEGAGALAGAIGELAELQKLTLNLKGNKL